MILEKQWSKTYEVVSYLSTMALCADVKVLVAIYAMEFCNLIVAINKFNWIIKAFWKIQLIEVLLW